MKFKEFANLPYLEAIMITTDKSTFQRLDEGQWINGRFDKNIRVDQPTHGVGGTHAHVLGRKGNEVGVVNKDGSSSHGTKARLHQKDADALRAKGFSIPASNLVEWLLLPTQPQLLLG